MRHEQFPVKLAGAAHLIPSVQNFIDGPIKSDEWPDAVKTPPIPLTIAKLPKLGMNPYLTQTQEASLGRFVSLGVRAAGDALKNAGLLNNDNEVSDVATMIGTTRGELSAATGFSDPIAKRELHRIKPPVFPLISRNVVAGQICITHRLQGDSQTFSHGDLSGIYSMQRAIDMIRLGRSQVVVAGGIEILSKVWLESVYTQERDEPATEGHAGTIAEGACFGVFCPSSLEDTNNVRFGPCETGRIQSQDIKTAIAPLINAFLKRHNLSWSDITCIAHHVVSHRNRRGLEMSDFLPAVAEETSPAPIALDVYVSTGNSGACGPSATVLALASALREAPNANVPHYGLAVTVAPNGIYLIMAAEK